MIIRFLLLFLLIGSLVFLVNSCARQSSPTGGPKDTIPPILTNSIPRQNEVNYKDKTVELQFSEMIILANPKEQIIIAPTTSNEYEVIAKKKSIVLKFEEPLKDSVTYSINFRDAVQDITEKNPATNLQLAFSTGSYIDSLTISGSVYNQLTHVAPKEATVAIHELNDTISIFKHKPAYLTKTNEQGQFIIRNLKPGTYTIFALEDKNRNLIADSRNESYAFKSRPITLPIDSGEVNLGLVRLDARPLKMTSARPYNNYFNIKTGKNMDRFTVTPTQPTDTIISSFGEDRSNVRIYDTFDADSVLVNFSAIDSLGNQLDSSLYVKFATRETTPDKYTATQDKVTLIQEKGELELTFKFNKPTFSFNQDSLLFVIDTAHVVQLSTGTFKWNNMTNQLTITKKIDPAWLKPAPATPSQKTATPRQAPRDTARVERQPQATPQKGTPAAKPKPVLKNQLIVGKGTFISIDQDTAPKLQKEIRPVKTEDLGIILAEVQTTAEHFIVQLLDKDFNIVKETFDNKKVRWEDITPADYRIRLVIDSNNNKKWDPGNYLLKEEPEAVFFYLNPKTTPPNTTHVKANWEVGPLLITSE
jgi:uncharacterized protein (DUF2141 family)